MEITWTVYDMDRYANHEGKEDVIFRLHWDCRAKQDGHQHRTFGMCSLDVTDLTDFTNFSEVTEEQVMQWLTDTLDVEREEAECQAGLARKITPEKLKGLPWRDADGEEEEG